MADRDHVACCVTHGVPRRLEPNPRIQQLVDENARLRERLATLERMVLDAADLVIRPNRVQ